MKHYWINIDKSIDRRTFMEKQFKNNKLDNERISAITPQDFDDVLEDIVNGNEAGDYEEYDEEYN
jgi:GR25 family glycosyltransferase involved in LPS biosynthesis